MKLYDIFEQNPDCNKFVIWKRNKYDNEYDINVKPVNEDGIDYRNAPSKKINWFKVIFSKRYRRVIKDCFDYAMWHADTYRGWHSSEILVSELITGISIRRNNSLEYSSEVCKQDNN